MKFVFIAKHRNIWPVAWLCNAMGVSRSGFHTSLNRSPSARSRSDCRPAGEGKLPCQGPDIRRRARLEGPFGKRRRMWPAPDRAADAPAGVAGAATAPTSAEWLCLRTFCTGRCGGATEPEVDRLFTYIWTAEGWLHVSAVIDLYSRRVVGWSQAHWRLAGSVSSSRGRWGRTR
jgi:putative transposase